MTLEKLMEEAKKFLSGPENFVAAEDALRPELAGMRIYEEPIFGVAPAIFINVLDPNNTAHKEDKAAAAMQVTNKAVNLGANVIAWSNLCLRYRHGSFMADGSWSVVGQANDN